MVEHIEDKIKEYEDLLNKTKKEISKVVVGQKRVIDSLLTGLIANGHIILEGVPGIAKTLMVMALAKITDCQFGRIQFTVDLLPSDIIGVNVYQEKKGFSVIKGPIFANFILADEINRAPPKIQSALLQAMQEKEVTIGRETFKLPLPFFVLATINPIETLGVYPLPEAQLDRFLFKIRIDYPTEKEEEKILDQNITLKKFDNYDLKPVLSSKKILEMQEFVKRVYLSDEVKKYVVELVNATRHPEKYGLELGNYIQYGVSPRASIGLYIGAKAITLMKRKSFVTPQEVKDIAADVFRHRIILNYEAQAEGISTEKIIKEILDKVPIK